MNQRELATKLAEQHLGLPYRWGGDDPLVGFDCSGLVIEILQSVGKLPRNADYTADDLSRVFPETEVLQPGALVFYDWDNSGRIDHVEMIVHIDDDGELYTIAASGGGIDTVDENSAQFANAYVKIRPLQPGHTVVSDPFD